jgi:hypothetical protein
MNKSNSLRIADEQRTTLGEGFVSDIELEQKIRVPLATIRRWRILGQGPEYLKFGKSVRYDLRSVQVWLNSLPSGGAGVPSSAVKRA